MWKIAKSGHDWHERGDTLVEVLIAIVIVSSVIGGAYVVSNRSLQTTRGAQERSTALKLAEAQLEQLKGLVSTNADAVFGATAPLRFCLASDVTGTQVYSTTIAAQAVHCKVDASGAPTTAQPAWTFEITRTTNDFRLRETWTDISGKYTDSLQLNYRAYKP